MTEQNLHELVKSFDAKARPEGDDPSAPATVGELNNLVTQTAEILNSIIAELYKK